ncbi:MAG TPA: DUF4290 domain-containing protein [Saprospiraceae bacterium]|nr:DUF4290 domain-containing protein [Saprospiraceae bacterium]MCB9329001.1 DUF4290 domain-containing protein [Lewinellaceae bacterium]HPK08804.1 DUF4290 domain-containing protein [Saprospiraceae bacterium]HPQ20608.1 DUF4290 domain-containing protein [Saprospiraceae bacterium]HRX29168.1 DUF4290 domain-containing protein [Saprospiraceae bacterium]
MQYNSRKEDLIISEYGRHVQELIIHAKTIQDDEYRQKFVESVVELMDQMNPQQKNVKEHIEKLWRHVFRIANYDLDVVPTVGERPTPENAVRKPDQLPYPQSEFRFRHYGHYIQEMIEKALGFEDNVKKMNFAYVIAAYMKLAYRTWNREHYVNDEIIKEDLRIMSKGNLVLPAEIQIEDLVHPSTIVVQSASKKSKKQKPKSNKGNSFKKPPMAMNKRK